MTNIPTCWRFGTHAWVCELAEVARLSGPITLTNIMQVAMGTSDVVMMGWLGPDAIAAGSLGFNLYFTFTIFGIGLLNAAAPLIANAVGRDTDPAVDVRRTVAQGFWLAAAVAIPIWGVLWWTEPILRLMGQDPGLAAAASGYVHTLQWSILPFLAYLVLRSFVSALSRPGWSLAVGCAALLINVGGNWCLMLGKCGFAPLGLPGSGLATLIATTFMFLGLVAVVCRDAQFRSYRLFARWWQPDWVRLYEFLWLGLPMAATLGFEVTIFNAAVFFMGLIGPAELAAHAIVIQLAALSFMVPLGIGYAAAIRVGMAHGAGDVPGIARAGSAALVLGLVFALSASLIMVSLPMTLIGFFLEVTKPENAHVVALARNFLFIAALFQFVDAVQAIGSGMLRGLQDVKMPMLCALLGYWGIGLPAGVLLAFPLGFGGIGIWIGLALGLAVVAGLVLWRWGRRDRLRPYLLRS